MYHDACAQVPDPTRTLRSCLFALEHPKGFMLKIIRNFFIVIFGRAFVFVRGMDEWRCNFVEPKFDAVQ